MVNSDADPDVSARLEIAPELVTLIEPEPEPIPDFDVVNLKIGRGDTLEKLFRQNNLNLGHLVAIATLEEPKKLFRFLKPGDEFQILHENGSIISMYSVLSLTSAIRIEHTDNGFVSEIIERPIEIRKRLAHGVINSSLFESGADAGLSDKVIMNIAGIFAWDVDFVLDIRRGDNFYVQYQEIWQEGEYVADGEISWYCP